MVGSPVPSVVREMPATLEFFLACKSNSVTGLTPHCRRCNVARCREYRLDHLEAHKLRNKLYLAELRRAALTYYGLICACCGESEYDFLTMDHIDGRDKANRTMSGLKLYRWLRANNYPTGFQTLCYNCNCVKGHHGVCPHERRRADGRGSPMQKQVVSAVEYVSAQ